MDGLWATRLIRSELGLADLPIIALSAGVLEEERRQTQDAGRTNFHPKPINIDELTRLIRCWLSGPLSPITIGRAINSRIKPLRAG
jgi:CheY-like chemotaxis protein